MRGKDATGIAYNNNGKLCVYKRPLPASLMRFKIPADAHVIMGHTRMTTQGSARKAYNNHPFPGSVKVGSFAFAHNGMIHNDDILRRIKGLPETEIETDSYIGVQLIEQKKALDFSSLRYMAEEVEVGGRTGGRGPACQGWGAPAAARGPQVLSLSPAHVGIRGHSGRAGTARLVRGQSPDVRGALVTATPNLQARLREAESLAQGHTAATRPRRDWGAQTVRLQSPSC